MSQLRVVSYRNSTSNHNELHKTYEEALLYLIEILHQTTTIYSKIGDICMLYLIEILHQTTTLEMSSRFCSGCILSKFYIKPQRGPIHPWTRSRCILSKFYIKPQPRAAIHQAPIVVSYRNSTSNHNLGSGVPSSLLVVSYRNSTSNHNFLVSHPMAVIVVSYRNSTSNHNYVYAGYFISGVVSYRNSTSNHNDCGSGRAFF